MPAGDDLSADPVKRLVGDLRAFERSLAAAFAAGGRLQLSAAEAHAEHVGGLAGHRIFAAIASANANLSGAIADTAGGHRLLEQIGRALGFDVTAYGDEHPKPPPGSLGAGAGLAVLAE